MSERDTNNVVDLLRPLLRDLHVQSLTLNPVAVKAAKYRRLIVAHLDRCIIVARQTNFSDDTKGCLSFSYEKKHNIFLFVINVDAHLFQDDDLESKIARKAVAVHEFVHCASALLLLSCLRPENFIERTKTIIARKVKLTTSDQFNALLDALKQIDTNNTALTSELLTDEHFRIGNDDEFTGNYGDLYLNFLLSYQLLQETMFALKINTPDISFIELLPKVHKELVEKKALQRNFVLGRIKLFLPNIFVDFYSPQ
jgi:hypothetical protein